LLVDGQQNIIADITQKRPILRILNSDGVSYYIGEKGEHIPLSDNFTPHVTIATGMVEIHRDAERDSILQANLYQLVLALRGDEFLNALVDQIVVKEDGSLDFIPKISGHIIHFGQVDENMNEKFLRLMVFYNEGMRKVGWNNYKAIDLRFNNQVVCEKRDTTNTL
jgi:cell division protein FtsQ